MNRCVILSAGPVEDCSLLRPLLREAADGGERLARDLGIQPNLLVADFDSSIPPETAGELEIVRLPAEKDWTDTLAAAMMDLESGYREFLLLVCT